MTLTVGIYLFDDVEVLDFAGPYEVFTTASRVYKRSNPHQPEPFSVFTVARIDRGVKARAGLVVHPDYNLSNHPAIDLLVIPGGMVTAELEAAVVADWIARQSQQARLVASVCTGAFLLAQAGLLDDKSATTHWEDIEDMVAMFPNVDVQDGYRWIDQGNVITSAGISAGIDMSLHLVERLIDRDLALKTARQMDFNWQENP